MNKWALEAKNGATKDSIQKELKRRNIVWRQSIGGRMVIPYDAIKKSSGMEGFLLDLEASGAITIGHIAT